MGFVKLWDKLSIHRYLLEELQLIKVKATPTVLHCLCINLLKNLNQNLTAFVHTARFPLLNHNLETSQIFRMKHLLSNKSKPWKDLLNLDE